MSLEAVPVAHLPPERFRALLGPRFDEIEEGMRRGRVLFAGKTIWHVNSTAKGGGVAELLQSLLAYARGAGVDNRWMVVGGEPEFFAITKRIHNNLHGFEGDGGPLGPAEREVYEETLADEAAELAGIVGEGEVVFLHDPQTAGMVAPMRAAGAIVVWRCHVGLDLPNEHARRAWDFLRPYVEPAHAYVFSREQFAWENLGEERVWIVPPSIDVFAPKNQELSPATVDAILDAAAIAEPSRPGGSTTFERFDGSRTPVTVSADMLGTPRVPAGAPLVAQVSRWDALKDPIGVIRFFTEHCTDTEAHLLLAGPSTAAIADDPEGAQVLADVRELRAGLAPELAERVHLASLPMEDIEENAAIVNAVQRRADVVVQKSIAEGFGLTVAEAMWKSRPVVASAVGGIQEQIRDGESGFLVPTATDGAEFGRIVSQLIEDPALRRSVGEAARSRVEDQFLGTRHLVQYLNLLQGLLPDSTTI